MPKLTKPEIRKDYIQEKYVIIAPQRTQRPHELERPEQVTYVDKDKCVFCPDNLKNVKTLLTIGLENDWQIKVIANIFPAVSLDNPKAYGIQEVIIETPHHHPEIEDLPTEHIAKLLEVYSERTKTISKNDKIEYILIFKNNGGHAGASLMHAHSQIFATQFLPPQLFDKSQKQQEYKLKHGTCVYCDVIKDEINGPRLIYQDELVIAFTPYASMYNYEVWIMPKRHLDNITMLTAEERMSFANILKKLLKKINELNLPYNYYFHQVVHDTDQHLYLKITPRGSVWAGVEIGSGIVINPIPPEEAAEFYRK